MVDDVESADTRQIKTWAEQFQIIYVLVIANTL